MKKSGMYSVLIIAAVCLLGACASTGETGPAPASKTKAKDVYGGTGEGVSLLEAINNSKADAVRNAVVDIIGTANEAAHADELRKALYASDTLNVYVFKESMVTLRKDKKGDTFMYEIEIGVNRPALETMLKKSGFTGGAMTVKEQPAQKAAAASEEKTAEPAEKVASTEADYDAPTPREAQFIRKYVDTMTYMVYFSDSSVNDPFLMKAAVGIANEYLASNSIEAVDLARIEELRKDQQLVYETETGEEVSVIQWIAQKLNADVYIEIDAVTKGEKAKNGYYGSANVTLKLFEASTGRLLGSVPYNSPKALSTSSENDAVINALQSSIYKSMPTAINQAKAYMEKALTRGIRYEVVVQNTPDTKVMSRFRTKLLEKVKDVQVVSQSPQESKYVVYHLGRIEDLESIIYDVADTVPGLEEIRQVLLRGKAITFNSGI